MNEKLYTLLNPNIDALLNPFIPHNQARHLPTPLSHFLGYRSTPAKEPPTLIQWLLTLVTTVAGICVVAAVYNYAPGITKWNPPTIVASLGASAVLDYNTIRSPLAQPRNNIVGHTIAAIVGVAISKAFQLVPSFFANYDWVAAAIACAVASVAMSVTNTVHPPGGATAILACSDAQIVAMGWIFPPIMLLSSCLMLGVALLFNNTLRQYPVFWWTPEEVGQKLARRKWKGDEEDGESEKGKDEDGSESTLAHELGNNVEFLEGIDQVSILPYVIRLPRHIELGEKEVELLQKLQDRVREHSEVN
jgi:hypothetical protein